MAGQRGYEIVAEYTDRISGVRARRPGLDQLMKEGRRGRFDVVLVWAADRIARSVKPNSSMLFVASFLSLTPLCCSSSASSANFAAS